jgi:hypothetical protein
MGHPIPPIAPMQVPDLAALFTGYQQADQQQRLVAQREQLTQQEIQGRQQEIQGRQAALADQQTARGADQAIRRAIADAGGDVSKALPGIRAIDPERASTIEAQLASKQKIAMDFDLARTKWVHERVKTITNDTEHQLFLRDAHDLKLNVAGAPDHYDPEWNAAQARAALSEEERYKRDNPTLIPVPPGGLAHPTTGAIVTPGAVKPPDVPKAGTFEDYVLRGAKAAGKTVEHLTPTDIEGFRKAYNQSDDRPRIDVNVSTPPVGDFAKSGDDFLATIPIQYRNLVKGIATYDVNPVTAVSARGGNREKVMAWVLQVNPGYKVDEFSNRAPTRKAFTTGVQGQQINAINTAIGHIDQLTGLADQLQTGGFVPGNRAWNAVRTAFGADEVTNFDTLKDALAGEVASVLSKGGATVSGIAEAKEKIHAANSAQQLAGYVKTLIPVMGSKLGALDYQYHQAMGADDAFSALSPATKAILSKHGVDPAGHGGGGGAAAAGPKDGDRKPIPGGLGTAEYRNGKWVKVQ